MATLKDAILKEIIPDEVISLTKDIVGIPSYTADETEVARFLNGFFERQGFRSDPWTPTIEDDRFYGDKDLKYEIEFPIRAERRQFREVMLPLSVPSTEPIVQILKSNVTAIVGKEPTVGAHSPESYAGNDTSHLWGAGIPCCLYGPAGGYDEARSDRWTSVEQIIACTRVFGATIADVCA